MWFSTSFDITWYAEAAIHAKNLRFSYSIVSYWGLVNDTGSDKVKLTKCDIFQKFSLKWKIEQHFMRPKQLAIQKKLLSLPQTYPHQTKSYYFCGTKIFWQSYTEIYRHLLSKCFKSAVPFFSDTKQKHVFWKTFKVRKAFAFLQEHIIFNVKWVTFCKMGEVFFERNCVVKWMTFLANFCLAGFENFCWKIWN